MKNNYNNNLSPERIKTIYEAMWKTKKQSKTDEYFKMQNLPHNDKLKSKE